MNFDKIVPTLLTMAPTLATALGTPLAGMAVSTLEQVLGLTPGDAAKDDGAALTKAVLGMSPETAATVRKADQDFQLAMKKIDVDVAELANKDRDSARNMQVQTKDWTPRVIGFVVVIGFFMLLALMAFVSLPVSNHDALMMLLGAVSAAFTAVMAFYFGSSSGSQAKDQTIKELSK